MNLHNIEAANSRFKANVIDAWNAVGLTEEKAGEEPSPIKILFNQPPPLKHQVYSVFASRLPAPSPTPTEECPPPKECPPTEALPKKSKVKKNKSKSSIY